MVIGRGGISYTFKHPESGEIVDACTALSYFKKVGQGPLSKWQVHLFSYQKNRDAVHGGYKKNLVT